MTRKPLFALSLTGLVVGAVLAQTPPGSPPRVGDVPREARDPRDAQGLEKRADLMGRVTAVSEDGRTLTLAMPPRPGADGAAAAARDARGEQATVTLTERTQVMFFGVGEGQARPAAGQMAMVWLADGSKDQAARVRLMKREGEERPDVQGRVVSVSPDGRTITVETRDRDQVTGRVDLRVAPYTQSLYFGVDRDGARPTPDYQVVAWLEKGSKDVASRVRFMKPEPRDPNAVPQPR